MDNLDREFEDELKFPMITVAVSHDDINEPIHVDLGSIQPFIAVSILEKVIEVLKMVSPGPKITFRGNVIADPNVSSEPVDFMQFLSSLEDGDEGGDSQPPTSGDDDN